MAKAKGESIKMAPGRAGAPIQFAVLPKEAGGPVERLVLICRETPVVGDLIDLRGSLYTVVRELGVPSHTAALIDGVDMLIPVVCLKPYLEPASGSSPVGL